ncbi:S8 family serine peptidase [Duganella sp. FT80W]|uniref:S8 family serine peptidase n=1 Tax=Duganella guangzhouensis TaxID=2666084 RepID=A0A6I2KU23_9BURK|nr:S8 family serine peptidase [Duganella guangzhouensis]MRW89475.1 S8 family serine peptidase [Duganella guangzhouensis]
MKFFTLLLALLPVLAHAEFTSFTATPNAVFANTPTSVTFVASLPAEPGLIKSSVRLLRAVNGVYGVVGTMHDDGLAGDALANDNLYTLTLSVPAASNGEYQFRASAAYTGVARRLQSETLPLQVLPALDLQITAGQQEITLLQGETVSSAFILQMSKQAGGSGNITAVQSLTPAGGLSLVTDLNPGGYSSTQSMQTFLVQDTFTALQPGDYTVKLDGTLNAGGASDQASATMLIHVLPANGAGQLGLTAYPGGIETGTSGAIVFGAGYTMGPTLPVSVTLYETNATGVILHEQGAMLDDGAQADLAADDQTYTTQPTLQAGPAGSLRYFKAVAVFASGTPVESPVVSLPSLPYHISFVPANPAASVVEAETGVQLQCDQVIVQFRADATLAAIDAAVAGVSGHVWGVEPLINAYQIGIPCQGIAGVKAALAYLAQQPQVVAAEPNSWSALAEFKPNDSRYASQYAPPLVRADEAWLIARGQGVVVAVLDSGVDYQHPDLVGRVHLGHDYVNNDADPKDDHSHGTHVAGIIGAKGHNSVGVAGMAWDAEILAIKVCGGETGVPGVGIVGGCPESAIISGILAATSQARIINMSLRGHKSLFEAALNLLGLKTAYQKAVEAASAAGVLVVAASGNDNSSDPKLPCAYPTVLCVGNTTSADVRYADPKYGSNYGAHVDIAAPGTDILSTVPTFADASGYQYKTGTSMASPLVAGVAALVWGNNPSMTRSQVEERLLKTALPLNQQVGPRVDAFDAVFNGSFEHDLSGWKISGTGSAVPKLGPISPVKGVRLGMASTGPDAAVEQSELYQEFTVRQDVTELALSFSYAMVTEEYPEWVGRGFNDDFRVTLETPDGVEHQVALETVDGSAFSAIGGIDFPGGDSTVGWTGWKNVVSVKFPLTAGAGKYRLRVRDRGDGIYDTNGLLDTIRFK